MTSIILTFIVSLLLITNSRALQDSTTKSCNYVVDMWWSTASPPSNSPTPEPTDVPTRSPTREPTMVNETLILDTDTDTDREGEISEAKSASGSNIILLLNPYRINQCYNLNFTSEPFNEVAWKYTCKDSSTLKREIWWDSLECTGNAGETIEISENERGPFTQFICDASKDCAYADITVVPAITMSPTPEPTEEPTARPTSYPTQTNAGASCAIIKQFFGCDYYIDNANVTCQCDWNCDYRGDCCSDYYAVCEEDRAVDVNGGSGSNSFVECDNTNGPQVNAETIYEWSYGTNICVSMLDFYAIFLEGENIENYTGPIWHIGWQCVGDSYYMALFNGSDCSKDPQKFIQYSDDSCAFDGGAWSHVSCSEQYQTPPPTPKPIIKPPTLAPTTTEGCRGVCSDGEICVVTTGECESKIVNQACKNDNQCIALYGAKYKCKIDQFCYLSECEEDEDCIGDAVGGYECENTEVESPIEYEYGICKEIDVGGGDGGGVESNGIIIGVAFIVGLSVFM
eukprot:205785_1